MIAFTLQFATLVIGGVLLAKVLLNLTHKLEIYFSGFLMNLGIFTFFWFVSNILDYPYTSVSSFFVLIILFLIYLTLFVLKYKTKSLSEFYRLFALKTGRFNKIDKILIGLISFLFVSSLITNIYWPVKDWDSLALYDFRAIVFQQTGFMNEGIELGYFFQYPLFTSLFHTWVNVNGLNNPMFIYSLIYISFVVIFYFSLRKFIGKTTSLFWTLFSASLPLIYGHSTMAYTNLSYSIFFVLASIYLYRYTITYQKGELFVSSVLLSLSIWTRYSEPFWIGSIIVAILFTLFRRKYLDLLIYLAIIFGSRYLWIEYLSTMNLGIGSDSNYMTNSILTALQAFNFVHIVEVIIFFYKHIITSWSFLFFSFVMVLIMMWLKDFRSILFDGYAVQLLLYLAILILGTYVFTSTFVGWKEIPDSAVRMSMFFPPMFIYLIAININKNEK